MIKPTKIETMKAETQQSIEEALRPFINTPMRQDSLRMVRETVMKLGDSSLGNYATRMDVDVWANPEDPSVIQMAPRNMFTAVRMSGPLGQDEPYEVIEMLTQHTSMDGHDHYTYENDVCMWDLGVPKDPQEHPVCNQTIKAWTYISATLDIP